MVRNDPGTVAMKISFQDGPIFKRSYLIRRPRFNVLISRYLGVNFLNF